VGRNGNVGYDATRAQRGLGHIVFVKLKCLLALALACPIAGRPALAAGKPSAQAVLEANCLSCHGKAQMSGLDLRSRDSLLRGGNRGAAVALGNANSSLLIEAVERTGELKMPPGDQPLDAADIAALREWIDAGVLWEVGEPQDSTWWSFRKPVRPGGESIDEFIVAKLREQGIKRTAPADRRTLVRRAYFDLHGLPPAPEEVDQFVDDESPDAFARLIDRLLESPRYGERWGRYWLDLVRYADTSGFETDHFYTEAWRYRDWVIKSFNEDKPYDVFVKEQIAADEIWGTDTDLNGVLRLPEQKKKNLHRRIGTSLFTLGAFPVEYTYYGDLYRAEWRAEAVDIVGSAFLGLTLECARCHDHKFDPISQRDYYRMAALFAGSAEEEIPLGSLFDVQSATRSFPLLENARILKRMAKQAKGEERAALMERLGEAYLKAPEPMPIAKVVGHEETVPETYVLDRGDFKSKGEKVEPGFLSALNEGLRIEHNRARRKALAEWLTSGDQPLVARVMVNRIWQQHFGNGLVRTPNDFGRQGEPPTHPKLLDWLAVEFVESGWSIKRMHRQIMLSDAYRAGSVGNEDVDPDNRYLSRMSRRRLDADAIRDSVLAVAGTLNTKMGGVGVIPPLSKEEILAARMPHLWPANPDPSEHLRRSVYMQMKRSMALPMLQIFDAPDSATSCARRETSTVAPQALAMMNSSFMTDQANRLADRIREQAGAEPNAAVEFGWRLAFGRVPSRQERQAALSFLERNSLPQLSLLLLNMSEFIYVD